MTSRVAITMLLLFLVRVSAEDIEKFIVFSNIHERPIQKIILKNETNEPITNIKIHVDCGCVKLEKWPLTLGVGETQNIEISVLPPLQEQRKVNNLLIEGSPGFHRHIQVVNFFYSEHPQVFGDTYFHLTEVSPRDSIKHVIIIGDITAVNIKTAFEENQYLHCELSKATEVDVEKRCYKRILSIIVDQDKLLTEGKSIVITRIDESQRLNLSIQ